MYDVVFFSSSLLIVLMSSQLFVGTPSVVSTVAAELNLPNPDIFIGSFSQNQPFLNYVYQLLEHHDSKPQQDYTIASKTLFTSLITLITSNISPQSGSLTSAMINGFQRRNSIVEGASRRLEAAVSAIDSPVLALLEGATENSSYMSDLFVTLGTT